MIDTLPKTESGLAIVRIIKIFAGNSIKDMYLNTASEKEVMLLSEIIPTDSGRKRDENPEKLFLVIR